MLLDLNHYSIKEFKTEARKLLALAIPMILGQIAIVGVGVVDTITAGSAGKADLTAVALGNSIVSTLLITFIGVMTALNPLVAQSYGANQHQSVGEITRQGMWFGLMLGTVGMLVMFLLIDPLKNYLSMESATEDLMGDYLFYTAFALPITMVYRALHALVSSVGKPKSIMWVSWFVLLLNIPLNMVFVYGYLGMPKMGGAGCGLATTLVFACGLLVMVAHVYRGAFFRSFALFNGSWRLKWSIQKEIFLLGLPIGLTYFLEASLFNVIVWLIADLGADTVSAQQVVMSISSISYMIPQAIGSSTTIRVGFAIGLRQFARARYVCGVATAMGLLLAVVTLVVMVVLRNELVRLYSSDAEVIKIAVSLLWFASMFQLFDFTQCIASYALRAYKITHEPLLIYGVAFWSLGLGLGYALAFGADWGVFGFWVALLIALATTALALLILLEKRSLMALKNRNLSWK